MTCAVEPNQNSWFTWLDVYDAIKEVPGHCSFIRLAEANGTPSPKVFSGISTTLSSCLITTISVGSWFIYYDWFYSDCGERADGIPRELPARQTIIYDMDRKTSALFQP
jgi:hypothetical protein